MITFKEYIQENQQDIIYSFDIDDTLVFTDSKIYYTEPGKETKAVSSGKFAKIRDSLHPDTEYDFREFSEFDNCYMSIVKGTSNIAVLRVLDQAIHSKNKIGIITARSNQGAVLAAIKDKILYKDKDGSLKKIPREFLRKKFVFAVGDPKTSKALGIQGGSSDPSKLKAYVLQKIFGDRMGFKTIYFYDDDMKNIKAVEELNDPRIKTFKV